MVVWLASSSSPPHFLDGSPIFAHPVPRVCIGGGDAEVIARYNMSLMTIADGDVPSQIVRHFHAAGRSRLAALTALTVTRKFHSTYKPLLRSLGMETRQEWWLGLPIEPTTALTARTVTHLLLSGSERQRPDCLLITDDNLLPHATAGAIDAGLELPRELTIIAHANYPGPTKSAIPCLRYGPDMEANVRAAVAEISHLAAGGKPRNIDVPNVFGET